jgi:hypothetical protein
MIVINLVQCLLCDNSRDRDYHPSLDNGEHDNDDDVISDSLHDDDLLQSPTSNIAPRKRPGQQIDSVENGVMVKIKCRKKGIEFALHICLNF